MASTFNFPGEIKPRYLNVPARPGLNLSHSLARGLVRAWPLGDGRTAAADVSLYGQQALTTVGTGTVTIASDGRGIATSLTGNCFMASPAPSDEDFVGALTLVTWANIANTATFRSLLCKQGASTTFSFPFEFRADSTTGFLNLTRANGGGFKQFTGPAITTGVITCIGVTCPDGLTQSTPTFYLNGVATAGTAVAGTATGAVTGTGASIRLGTRPDGVTTTAQTMRMARIYKRALSASEMAWLFAEPYAGLEPAYLNNRVGSGAVAAKLRFNSSLNGLGASGPFFHDRLAH